MCTLLIIQSLQVEVSISPMDLYLKWFMKAYRQSPIPTPILLLITKKILTSTTTIKMDMIHGNAKINLRVAPNLHP